MPKHRKVDGELQLLQAKLDASNAKLEAEQLRNEVRQLQTVISQYQTELRESRRLLLRQRLPRRPFCSSTERQLIAASQGWKCAGFDECPLKVINGGGSSIPRFSSLNTFSRGLDPVATRVILSRTAPGARARKHGLKWRNVSTNLRQTPNLSDCLPQKGKGGLRIRSFSLASLEVTE